MNVLCFLLNAGVATMYTAIAASGGGTWNVVLACMWWVASALWLSSVISAVKR